jgi:hypothetical protein
MKKIVSLLLLASILFMVGCSTHIHVVGDGGKAGTKDEARQWYILFGLVPLNDVKSKTMAGDASNYTIKTQATFLDGVITLFTSIVTISCRTVEVSK